MFKNLSIILLCIGILILIYLYSLQTNYEEKIIQQKESIEPRYDLKDDFYVEKQFENMFKKNSTWESNNEINLS